nr:uncharacterized protein LOC115255424 [Aedes albopictus]
MEKRVHKLKTSMAFKVCLYLDPRFNFAGSRRMSESDKRDAQQYLVALNNRLDKLDGLREEPTEVEAGNSSGFVEDYLMDFFDEGNADVLPSTSKNSSTSDSLLFDLLKLENREKVNITAGSNLNNSGGQPGTSFDILEYWKKRKFSNPRVYRLAMVVLAAPSTQITVERLFSQVKFVLTDSRMRLSSASIKDIMVLKMNEDLLGNVVDVILERNDLTA